jgi:hypothetical protein
VGADAALVATTFLDAGISAAMLRSALLSLQYVVDPRESDPKVREYYDLHP